MKHNHDIVYYNEWPEEQCNENYIDETGRRISEGLQTMPAETPNLIFINIV